MQPIDRRAFTAGLFFGLGSCRSRPPSAQPDLVVTAVSWSPDTPRAGDAVTFNAAVENRGTAATPDGVVHRVAFEIDGAAVAWSDTHTTSIPPGASVTLATNGGPSGAGTWPAVAGIHTLRAHVDDVGRISELDETNNTLDATLTVAEEPGRPDLVVAALRWSDDGGASWHTGPIRAGSDVWFEADVRNQGTGPTPAGVIVGVAFLVDGAYVAWSDTRTQAVPAGATVSLRANGGPDGDRYWNNVQAGAYTVRAHVDDVNRFPDELDKTNNTLDVSVTVQDASSSSAVTVSSVSGGGNIHKNSAATYMLADLVALRCGIGRLALHPHGDYWFNGSTSPTRNDAIVLQMLNAGIRPFVIFEFESSYNSAETGVPQRNYHDWYSIGNAFAARFRPNSPFLISQGISRRGIVEWSAINEPDRLGREDPALTYNQYHDMLRGLGDGVHAADPTAKVYPAGYLCANRDQNYTGWGYLSRVAPLINNGTLNGFDLHTYHDRTSAPIYNTYNRSHQRDFERCIQQSGITRLDIDWVCTEHTVKAEPIAGQQGYDSATARRWYLTHFFDVHGATRANGSWAPGARLTWNIWMGSHQALWMSSAVNPRVIRECGHTHKMLMDLLHDMRFVGNDPKGTGTHKLRGGGKTVWVFQNIHSSWSSLYGNTFTISEIPAAATRIDAYDGMGLIQTVTNPSKPSHTFSTPTGKSYLFVANAE